MLMTTLLAGMPDLCQRILDSHVEDGHGRCGECAGVPWPCDLRRIAQEAERLRHPRRRSARPAQARFLPYPRQPRHRAEPRWSRRPGPGGRGRPTPPVAFLAPRLPDPRPAATGSNADAHGPDVRMTAMRPARAVDPS